jgi:hypothetical protein
VSVTIYWDRESTITDPEGGDTIVTESGDLTFDVLVSETYSMLATVTSHAVEEGAPITDHINVQQDRESMELIISDSPMDVAMVDGAAVTDLDLGNGQVASVLQVPDNTSRSADAFLTLRSLLSRGFLVDVEGARRPMEGWVIESVSTPRRVEDTGALVCTVSFVEIRTATFEEIDAPAPRVERARNRRDQGRNNAQEGADGTAANSPGSRSSVLNNLAEGARGLL